MHELGVCRNSGDDAIGETAKEGLAKFTQLDDAHKETTRPGNRGLNWKARTAKARFRELRDGAMRILMRRTSP